MPKDKNSLTTGMNGGYQALVLAILAGASRIILLGYDMQYGKDGVSHWHGGHSFWRVGEGMYLEYAKKFDGIKAPEGVTIINSTPRSRIKRFQRMDLLEALAL